MRIHVWSKLGVAVGAVLAAGILLAAAQTAAAKEYTVSPSGDDANAGTSPKAALRTIDRAAKLARAGDVVTILPGEYVGRIRPAASGTPEAPIVYRKVGDGEAVITTRKETDGGKWHERFAVKFGEGNNYTVIEGLTFRDAEAWVYIGDGAHHVTVKDCTFDGNRMYHGIYINNGSFNTIAGCRFVRAIAYPKGWQPTDPEPALADYISVWRDSHYNLIEGCTFGEISHVAVCIMGHDPEFVATHNIVRNCTFTDPKWKCVSFHAAEHTLVEGCRMSGLAAAYFQFHAARTIIRRNVFSGYRAVQSPPHPKYFHGVLWLKSGVNEYGSMDLAQHSRIYHNTFADCEVPLTYRGSGKTRPPVCDNVFKNNIFSGFATPLRLPLPFYKNYTTQEANPFVGNLLSGGPEGGKVFELIAREQAQGRLMTLAEVVAESPKLCRKQLFEGNVEADPQFADAAGGDWRLKAGSPCIDAGAPLARTRRAGQGTQVAVDDALYFCDGFRRIPGDVIVVGSNAPARIVEVDYDTRTVAVDRALSWAKGDAVNLAYEGKGPDIGAMEFGAN